jgi:hypothetical protein
MLGEVAMFNNNSTPKDIDYISMIERLSAMSPQEFLELGANGFSYIKTISLKNETPLFMLCAADGSHIATGQNFSTLEVIARQNNLVSLTIH